MDNTDINKDCWKLLKSLQPEDEDIKIHFNRLIHNTLPTKAKIFSHVSRVVVVEEYPKGHCFIFEGFINENLIGVVFIVPY